MDRVIAVERGHAQLGIERGLGERAADTDAGVEQERVDRTCDLGDQLLDTFARREICYI
jgi:hypothetical protein